ncbi:hypothetical protein PVAP13_7NG177717 [Panicum virgatum]|uniref:Uncharacterized protein n=1 Tax=Panicum virgatum TaxID=38727 RepID=A0A8T0PW07_PANVG|nr:hypothetical protein PVAP13_7NG177717 [Panicum virgatum]
MWRRFWTRGADVADRGRDSERERAEQSHCRRRRVRRPHARATAVEAGSCSSSPVCPASAPAPERRAPPAVCKPERPHLVLLLHAVVRAAATRPAHARAPPRLAVLLATAPLGPRPLLQSTQQAWPSWAAPRRSAAARGHDLACRGGACACQQRARRGVDALKPSTPTVADPKPAATAAGQTGEEREEEDPPTRPPEAASATACGPADAAAASSAPARRNASAGCLSTASALSTDLLSALRAMSGWVRASSPSSCLVAGGGRRRWARRAGRRTGLRRRRRRRRPGRGGRGAGAGAGRKEARGLEEGGGGHHRRRAAFGEHGGASSAAGAARARRQHALLPLFESLPLSPPTMARGPQAPPDGHLSATCPKPPPRHLKTTENEPGCQSCTVLQLRVSIVAGFVVGG